MTLTERPSWLIRLRPRPEMLYVGRGRTVLASDTDGFLSDGMEHGLFVHETRLLSRYRYLVDGRRPFPVALSNVEQHSWLGYYILAVPGIDRGPPAGEIHVACQDALEMRLSRSVGPGVHEDVDLTNFTRRETSFDLELEVDADFADQEETRGERLQNGERTVRFSQPAPRIGELAFDYRAEHHWEHQGESGVARIERGLALRIEADSAPSYRDGRIVLRVSLGPGECWHGCVDLVAFIDGVRMPPAYGCHAFVGAQNQWDRSRRTFIEEATRFEAPARQNLETVVVGTLEQGKRDLDALRLHDLDVGEHAWTMAAGLPVYLALFGRDTLTAAWQASLASTDMLRGVPAELARWQGTTTSDWRDEQPGKMLHEAHTGPLAALRYNPRDRYYGSATTSGFYGFVVSELWHWTGDRELVGSLIEPALRAERWLDEYADLDGDGFYEYRTRSEQGLANQGWKDSWDGIVDENGEIVRAPIATCEEQAFAYVAKLHLSEVLWWFGRRDEAKRMFREAGELRKRFNDVFWQEDLGFFAMALGPDKRPVRSIASNPGHCLAAGIVDGALVERTANRLLEPDMFSGWGIRTLSSDNPAYNPYSYHRGSVWPVEQGTFALAFMRHGFKSHLQRLCKAVFESSALFDFYRLPELFAGHARDDEHPFPALYPPANTPQAWSASVGFCLLQAMLGLYPYAPLRMLIVDPDLPEWLPEITLRNLRVGRATVTLRFRRDPRGRTRWEVLDRRGRLHVVQQPSPWSITAGFAERAKDVLTSLRPSF